jgi:hypothetical protein
MFEESNSNADEPPVSESAAADSAPVWHPNGTGEETAEADATVAQATEASDAADSATASSDADGTDVSPTDIGDPNDNTTFLAHLAQAMKTTVAVERARITQDADRRRDAHIAGIHARRESESVRMRELAGDDLRAIDSWAEQERARIEQERERRAASVRRDLEASLAEHGAKIDGEIQAVDMAVAAYRSDVEAFFITLDHETDPVAIAQHAGSRPAFPPLDASAAPAAEATPDPGSSTAPAEAESPAPTVVATAAAPSEAAAEAPAIGAPAAEAPAAETPAAEPVAATASAATIEGPADRAAGPMIGVMDTTKPATKLAQAWAAWQASTEAADEARAAEETAAGDDGADGAATEATHAVAAGSYKPAGESTPRAQQSSGGPMSWLRRDKDHSGS